jgi:hypothetical protein
MADLRGFDANQVRPSSNLEPLPAGQYLAVITESEMRPNKAGTGSYLQITFEIIDGPHKGRRVWSRLNLDNPNATAVAIAQSELSAICRAVGVMRPGDSTELHDLPLVIHVVCRQRPDRVTNEIKGYSPKAAAAAPAAPPAVKPAAPGAPPWKR